jgi:hypothetical protein
LVFGQLRRSTHCRAPTQLDRSIISKHLRSRHMGDRAEAALRRRKTMARGPRRRCDGLPPHSTRSCNHVGMHWTKQLPTLQALRGLLSLGLSISGRLDFPALFAINTFSDTIVSNHTHPGGEGSRDRIRRRTSNINHKHRHRAL